MTTIINLYGGPGTGKSTSAELLYCTQLHCPQLLSEGVRSSTLALKELTEDDITVEGE